MLGAVDHAALLVQVVLQLGALAARDFAVGLRLALVLTNLARVPLKPQGLAPRQLARADPLADALLLMLLSSVDARRARAAVAVRLRDRRRARQQREREDR